MSVSLPLYDWSTLSNQERAGVLKRPPVSLAEPSSVQAIIDEVRAAGDEALRSLTSRFDQVDVDQLRVRPETIANALTDLDTPTRDALTAAYANIERFHASQRTATEPVTTARGVTCEQFNRPIEAVGLYVPGGTAPLPSTVLMLGVPSRLAGCPVRILCTPPQSDGRIDSLVLAAAALCGIEQVYSVGGAQAIAAMAYGTETIPKVNKIFGPGNPWVTRAKQLVAQDPAGAGCDLPAGPSEVLVIADETANPAFVAADLLAQAEHGADSQVVLVTTSERLAANVQSEVAVQLASLSRRETAAEALSNSRVILAGDKKQAFAISNAYAPEHLIINSQSARDDLPLVQNAGSVFLGAWTPESLGDYCSGTNHVLPTHGYASHISGVGLSDFEKRITVQEATAEGLNEIGWIAERIATSEGLDAHARAVSIRTAGLRSLAS